MKITIDFDGKEDPDIIKKLILDLAAYEKESRKKEASNLLDGLNEKKDYEKGHEEKNLLGFDFKVNSSLKDDEIKIVHYKEKGNDVAAAFLHNKIERFEISDKIFKRVQEVYNAGGLRF